MHEMGNFHSDNNASQKHTNRKVVDLNVKFTACIRPVNFSV